MYAQVEKPKENKSRTVDNSVAQKKSSGKQGFWFVDNRLNSKSDIISQLKVVEWEGGKTQDEKSSNPSTNLGGEAIPSTCKPLQMIAITRYPTQYRADFNPKYQTWRDILWNVVKSVYKKYTITQIVEKINDTDPTHIGEEGIHQRNNQNFVNERTNLDELMNLAKNSYDGNAEESDQALQPFTNFVNDLDRFLDKWEDTYSEEEKTVKSRQAEILVKVTTNSDLNIKWFDQFNFSSTQEQYTETLIKHTLSDPRLIATLRGKDSFKLHLRDDDPQEVDLAIRKAVQKLRSGYGHDLNQRIKPTDDTEWNLWRKNDCVFAAIIYAMNNDTAKYTSVLGQNPQRVLQINLVLVTE